MAALLTFHILGLYPVPSSRQLLIGSPLVSSYTLSNDFFGTSTTVTVTNFDPAAVADVPSEGSNVYVQSVKVNGTETGSLCWIEWGDLVSGGTVEITVGSEVPAAGCDSGLGDKALPDSLGTGGFS